MSPTAPGSESAPGCSPPSALTAAGTALEEHLTGAGVTLLPGSRALERTSTATATIAEDGSASYAFDITRDVEPLDLAPTPPKVLHTGSIASFLAPGAGKVKAIGPT